MKQGNFVSFSKRNRNDYTAISTLWVGSFLGAGFAFLTQVILARQLSPFDFGVFSAGLATVSLLNPMAGFGVHQYWLKSFGEEGWNATRWFLPSFRFITLCTIFVILLIVIGGLLGPHDNLTTYVLLILAISIPGQVSVELLSAKFQLEEKFIYLTIWQLMPHIARLSLVVLLAYIITERMDVIEVAWAYAWVAILAVIIGVHQLYHMFHGKFDLKGHLKKENVSNCNNQTGANLSSIQKLIGNLWPFGFAGLFHLIYFQSDIIFVKYLTGSEAAGAYNIASTIMVGVYLLPSTLYQKYLLPKMHRWAHHDREKFSQVYKQGNIILLAIGIIVMFGLWAISSWVIPFLFGEKYQNSIILLNIISVSTPIMFVAFSAGTVLMTKDNMKKKVKIMGVVAVINILFNMLFIPYYGAVGAAVSTVISNLFLLAFYFQAAQKAIVY